MIHLMLFSFSVISLAGWLLSLMLNKQRVVERTFRTKANRFLLRLLLPNLIQQTGIYACHQG